MISWTYLPPQKGERYGSCKLYKGSTTKTKQSNASSGKVVYGQCRGYNKTSGTRYKKGVAAGGEAAFPTHVKLWPSWPGSSQWVTSVGATRFENQDVTAPEIA